MMIPNLTDAQLLQIASDGEVKLYKLLRENLQSPYVVFFQAAWILSFETDDARDGEIDFLICHPEKGYLALEVKGGGISLDPKAGKWSSTDRNGVSHDIKDPIKQAMRAKYAISKKFSERKIASKSSEKMTRAHAVYFPDIASASSIESSDRPREIIGTAANNARLKDWIENVFDFWASGSPEGPGQIGMALFEEIFARPFDVKALTSWRISQNEERILHLTSEQVKLLLFISSHRRVTVHGGAGTGKTVLAVEKSKMLASEGRKVLLTCYNRPLADFLSACVSDEKNISVLTIHQLAVRFVESAKSSTGRDLLAEMKHRFPGTDLWDVQMPLAMWEAADFVSTRFDAIVCDEAQDFPEDFWMPLQHILTDFEYSPFYVFRDDNQNIFRRNTSNPFPDAPFQLTENCRNSAEIHNFAYSTYIGPRVEAGVESGIAVGSLIASNFKDQAELIVAQIRKLLNDPGISADQIAVLISSQLNVESMKAELASLQITKNSNWTANLRHGSNEILIETVKRFKGLEKSIVLLWVDDVGANKAIKEEIYVGGSRARSQLITISSKQITASK